MNVMKSQTGQYMTQFNITGRRSLFNRASISEPPSPEQANKKKKRLKNIGFRVVIKPHASFEFKKLLPCSNALNDKKITIIVGP